MSYENILSHCTICPRECGADRFVTKGFCGEGSAVRIARAELHMWEEPCISGKNGSGTVFFSGCSLKCCFCQNFEISHNGKGFELTVKELSETFLRLQDMGAHNINLVDPTHFVPQIINAIDLAGERLTLPIVYNSGGYDKPETLKMLDGRVKIFLPDLKYFDSEAASKYSAAPDYFDRAIDALLTMVEIAGRPVIKDGIMQSGVIVRHMILPGHRKDSIVIIKKLREYFSPNDILVSLMSQYTPVFRAHKFPEIDRSLTQFEYRSVQEELEKSGFDGFVQERTSASENFIPKFFDKKYY